MNIIVLMKRVPDLVEDLEVDSSGRALDAAHLKFTLNEFESPLYQGGFLLVAGLLLVAFVCASLLSVATPDMVAREARRAQG